MRNRYLDLLRAAAIVRVIIYHLFGWPWLSIVLPAMGIMFALAGSLTAASLDKRAARLVVASRLRRLLPPLWLLGLIAVPVMLAFGWAHEAGGDHPFSIPRLAFWLLPLGDPPGSDKGVDVWEPLWYIRAYVWFILLSPLLYVAYRRIGWLAVAAPLVLMAVLDRTGFSLPDTADAAMWDFATYGACWIAGFAHHDGRLARVRGWLVILAAAVLGAAALYWLRGHQGEDAWDLNDVSESQALWSVAFVLLALRWQPSMRWLARARPLDRAVTLLNGRAVTIYLWHNIAIALVWPVLTVLTLDSLGRLEGPVDLVVALLLTGFAVLAFGWAEDLAAKRRPRLWPTGRPAPSPEPVAVERSGIPALVGAPDQPQIFGTAGATLFGAAAPAGPGGSAAAAALGGRTSATAALTRRPASVPPAPRTGADAETIARLMAVGRHQSGDIGSGTRDLGLPVAGRRAEPINGPTEPTAPAGSAPADKAPTEPAPVNDAPAGSGPVTTTGSRPTDHHTTASGPADKATAGSGPIDDADAESGPINHTTTGPRPTNATTGPGPVDNATTESGPTNHTTTGSRPADDADAGSGPMNHVTNGPRPVNHHTTTASGPVDGTESADQADSANQPGDDGVEDAEVWEGEISNGESTGTWATTGPVLGTPSEFGWTAAPTAPGWPREFGESGGPCEAGEARETGQFGGDRDAGAGGAGREGGPVGGERDEAGGGRRTGPWPRRGGPGGGIGAMPDWFRHRRDNRESQD